MNLLIRIPVHDIKGLRKTANLTKLICQTKLIHNVEISLYLTLLPKCMRCCTLARCSLLHNLTVHPLDPREKTLPCDVLLAAYKVVKEKDGHYNYSSCKKTYDRERSYYTETLEDDASITWRRRGFDEDTLAQDCNSLKNEIAEHRKICEKILQALAKICDANK